MGFPMNFFIGLPMIAESLDEVKKVGSVFLKKGQRYFIFQMEGL